MTVPATAITEEASLARSSRVKALRAGLAGDLTSILSKGLAEAPDEPYDNVQSFAADLGNWLAGNAGHRQAGEPGLSRPKFVAGTAPRSRSRRARFWH